MVCTHANDAHNVPLPFQGNSFKYHVTVVRY